MEVDFVAEGGFRLIDAGFRKLRWISWISVFRPTHLQMLPNGLGILLVSWTIHTILNYQEVLWSGMFVV